MAEWKKNIRNSPRLVTRALVWMVVPFAKMEINEGRLCTERGDTSLECC
jgi:hypothetical protein